MTGREWFAGGGEIADFGLRIADSKIRIGRSTSGFARSAVPARAGLSDFVRWQPEIRDPQSKRASGFDARRFRARLPIRSRQVASHIHVKGAREHNLKNLELRIPRGKLVVVTGPSGSGKSSLAFDTIYAEGYRKYIESLSAQARQVLEQLKRTDVDFIHGLSPVLAIEQRTGGGSPRSTEIGRAHV